MFYALATAAFGPMDCKILSLTLTTLGGALRARLRMWTPYTERYVALWFSGIYLGENKWVGPDGLVEVLYAPVKGASEGGVYAMDAGLWPSFTPEQVEILECVVRIHEEIIGNRPRWRGVPSYSLTDVRGDTQLSGINITGAKRGQNVAGIEAFSTRGRLHYSIVDVAGVYIVRWYAGNRLVAEGSRTGDGALTFSDPASRSGLTGNCTLAYVADVAKGDAWIDCRWPARLAVYISSSPIVIGITPVTDYIYDNGADAYQWIGAEITVPGTYYWAIVEEDDDGTLQGSITHSGTFAINTRPVAPTITGITGTAAALAVAWTRNGQTGATYTVMSSLADGPINTGDATLPAPIVTAVDATSATLAALTDYASIDREPFYDAVVSAIDSAVVGISANFSAGETGFSALFVSYVDDIRDAITDLGDDLQLGLSDIHDALDAQEAVVVAYLESIAGELTSGDWLDAVGPYILDFYAWLGTLLANAPARYALPNGSIVGGAAASDTLGVGTDPGGSTGYSGAGASITLLELCTPFIKYKIVRVKVQATKDGYVDNDGCLVVEVPLDASGAIVVFPPAPASIQRVTQAGLTLSVLANVIEDDQANAATHVDLIVAAVASGIPERGDTASATGTLPTSAAGYHQIAIPYTVGAAGWYYVAVYAKRSGIRALTAEVQEIFVDNAGPVGPLSGSMDVVRGAGGRYRAP